MTPVDGTKHPEPAVLAAYLDGTLTPSETEALMGHLDACFECRETLSVASATLAESVSGGGADHRVEGGEPGVDGGQRGRPGWLRPVLAAAAIAALVVVPGRRLLERSTAEAPAVTRETGEERSLALTAGTPAEGATLGDTRVFTWEAVETAASYRLLITDDVGDVVWSTTTPEVRVPLPDSVVLAPGLYFWVVDALLVSGREATTGARTFRVEGPAP